MTEVVPARPTPEEAASLLHALCERVAVDTGTRVLAIKGPVVAMQGLRKPRVSADIDILVHPDDLTSFVDRMHGIGWHRAVEPTSPRLVRSHSINLLHNYWPLGVDVHHYFPGFLAPDDEVFEVLWSRRAHYTLAGVPVTACDSVGQAALVGLHLLREDPDGTSARVDDLIDHAEGALTRADLRVLLKLAVDTDCVVPLRPVLLRLGIDQAADLDAAHPDELASWLDRARVPPGAVWGQLLRDSRWTQWPAVVWHSLLLTDEEISAYYGGGDTRLELARARLRRLGTGLHLIPGILRGLIARRNAPPSSASDRWIGGRRVPRA